MRALVTDTETAGLQGGVCDLAFIEIDNDLNIVREFESLIDPERPISPEASGVHHITDEMVYDKPTMSELIGMHGNPFDHDNLVLIGHNIQFDARMLVDVLPQQYRTLCTLKLARNLYPDLESHKLQTIRYTFKLHAGDAHRAMGDVVTCLSFLRLIANERGLDLQGLMELGRKPLTLEAKMPFGKHKGLKLKDVPMSYVRWLLDKAEVDPDLREALASRI